MAGHNEQLNNNKPCSLLGELTSGCAFSLYQSAEGGIGRVIFPG